MRPLIAVIIAVLQLLIQSAGADSLGFGPRLETAGWRTTTMPTRAAAKFAVDSDGSLQIVADAAVGWLWRPVAASDAHSTRAQWAWRVEEGVGPTDLTRRGSDDRPVAVYFVFGEPKDAGSDPATLLRAGPTRALVYVFGGSHPRGTVLASPHMGSRGRFLMLQPADGPRRQWLEERVDLVADFRRAFAGHPPALIAVVISSDSDDTRGRNHVRLRDLVLTR